MYPKASTGIITGSDIQICLRMYGKSFFLFLEGTLDSCKLFAIPSYRKQRTNKIAPTSAGTCSIAANSREITSGGNKKPKIQEVMNIAIISREQMIRAYLMIKLYCADSNNAFSCPRLSVLSKTPVSFQANSSSTCFRGMRTGRLSAILVLTEPSGCLLISIGSTREISSRQLGQVPSTFGITRISHFGQTTMIFFMFATLLYIDILPPNGLRYPSRASRVAGLVGETRQRHFDGTHFKPRKVPENAQTPTTPVPVLFRDAVLGYRSSLPPAWKAFQYPTKGDAHSSSDSALFSGIPPSVRWQ